MAAAKPSRVAETLAYLQSVEELCVVCSELNDRILDTQSVLAMELAGWHELLADIDLLEADVLRLKLRFQQEPDVRPA